MGTNRTTSIELQWSRIEIGFHANRQRSKDAKYAVNFLGRAEEYALKFSGKFIVSKAEGHHSSEEYNWAFIEA